MHRSKAEVSQLCDSDLFIFYILTLPCVLIQEEEDQTE